MYEFLSEGCRLELCYGQQFFILQFSLASHSSQFDLAHTNETNHDMHQTNTLFEIGYDITSTFELWRYSRYSGDIYYPQFEKYISDIYPPEL